MLRFIKLITFGVLLSLSQYNVVIAQMDTVSLQPIADSYVYRGTMSTNYGSDTLMRVGLSYDTVAQLYAYNRGFVAFNLNTIPSNAIIYSATLKLHVAAVEGDAPSWKIVRLIDTLNESGINASNQSDFSDFSDDMVSTASQSGSVFTYELKSMVQRIVGGGITNYGWMIQVSDETVQDTSYTSFYTRESGNSSNYPELVVQYYLPHQLTNVIITHESDSLAGDGSIDLDILGGTQDFSWEWRNSSMTVVSTDTILESVSAGWYGLRIQGNTYPDENFYYSFLVGTDGHFTELDFPLVKYPYQNGENYMDVASVKDLVAAGLDHRDQNFNNSSLIEAERALASGTWYSISGYFKLRLWIDEELTFDKADLFLKGAYHYNHVGTVLNDVYIRMLTEDWNPDVLCYNNAPSYTTEFEEYIPTTMENGTYSYYQNRYLNLINYFSSWQQDNNQNYGLMMQLTDPYDFYHRQRYSSTYNAAYLGKSPELKLKYGVFPDPPTFSVSDTSNFADIAVDITEVAGDYTSPYFYQISTGSTPRLDSLIALYSDTSLFVGIPDSLIYAQGINQTTNSFQGVTPNKYKVTVHDSAGFTILENTLLVQDTLDFDEQTDLVRVDLNEVRAVDLDAAGSLDYYVSEGKNSQFTIELESSSEVQLYGYVDIDSTIADTSDIYYGFYIEDDTAFLVTNGSKGSMLAEITDNSIARIVNENDSLRIEIDGVSVHTSIAPSSYLYKVGVMTQPAAAFKFWQNGMVPIKKKPYYIETTTPSRFSCSGDLGYFTFFVRKVKNDLGYTVSYSVDDSEGNTILTSSTNTLTTTLVTLDGNNDPIKPGFYTVYGTINSNPSLQFSTTVFVGYETIWSQEVDYDISGIYEERDANTDVYASARSSNTLRFDQDGTIQFSVENTSSTSFFKHFIQFTTDYPNATPFDQDFVNTDFLTIITSFGTDYLQVYEANQGFTQPGIALQPSDLIRIELKASTNEVEIYVNNQLKETISRNSSLNTVRIYTTITGDRFKDIMTSFGCTDWDELFAHLNYKMNGYYHVMKDGLIKFVFDQEYDAEDLTFNIYNDMDELVKTQSDFSSVSSTNGRNYLTIDVSQNGSSCLGEGFFYLEVINSKKERMYLRFHNEHSNCSVNPTE